MTIKDKALKLNKGQRIVYYKGLTPKTKEERELLVEAHELYDMGLVNLVQKCLNPDAHINRVYEYIAERV